MNCSPETIMDRSRDNNLEHQPFYTVRPLLPVYPEPGEVPPGHRRLVLVQDGSVFHLEKQGSGTVFMPDPLPAGIASGAPVYLGICKDRVYYAAGVPDGAMVPCGGKPLPVRELSGRVPEHEEAVASYAVRVLDYDRSTAYCGRCGAMTRPLATERAKVCPACSSVTYPRISPAVIVLVKKGEAALLARSPGAPPGFFSLIAGFNEPGENLEETVRREVREEAGIEVRNLRYFGSEPWPFPDSLMTGFVADHAGGEIRTDGREIEAAGWFARDNLPLIPTRASISRALITAWVRGDI